MFGLQNRVLGVQGNQPCIRRSGCPVDSPVSQVLSLKKTTGFVHFVICIGNCALVVTNKNPPEHRNLRNHRRKLRTMFESTEMPLFTKKSGRDASGVTYMKLFPSPNPWHPDRQSVSNWRRRNEVLDAA